MIRPTPKLHDGCSSGSAEQPHVIYPRRRGYCLSPSGTFSTKDAREIQRGLVAEPTRRNLTKWSRAGAAYVFETYKVRRYSRVACHPLLDRAASPFEYRRSEPNNPAARARGTTLRAAVQHRRHQTRQRLPITNLPVAGYSLPVCVEAGSSQKDDLRVRDGSARAGNHVPVQGRRSTHSFCRSAISSLMPIPHAAGLSLRAVVFGRSRVLSHLDHHQVTATITSAIQIATEIVPGIARTSFINQTL